LAPPDLTAPLVFSICGHITSFVAALDELAEELGELVHSTMSVVPPIGTMVQPRIVVVAPPSVIERRSIWMVGQLGTVVGHTTSAVPFRMPRVPPHDPINSLSERSSKRSAPPCGC
jgi:hypothetical protein